MPLVAPWHAIPGELLTSTELVEDADFNKLWKVPDILVDISEHFIPLQYGDLWLVIASWGEEPDTDNTFDREVFRKWPALLLHLRSCKLFKFEDIEAVGWLWRPDPAIDELREEIRATAGRSPSGACHSDV